jgi:hypothetical protein
MFREVIVEILEHTPDTDDLLCFIDRYDIISSKVVEYLFYIMRLEIFTGIGRFSIIKYRFLTWYIDNTPYKGGLSDLARTVDDECLSLEECFFEWLFYESCYHNG